jgi:hypothetical protein
MNVTMISRNFLDGAWHVIAHAVDQDGARCGPHLIDLSEQATDEQLLGAVIASYA